MTKPYNCAIIVSYNFRKAVRIMKRILAIMLSLLTIAAVFVLPMNAAGQPVVTEGLVIHYDGSNNTGNGQDKTATVWKDVTGNGHDFVLELDEYNKWGDNAFHADGAFYYLPEKAVEVINGQTWTVEITLGQIELLGSSYDTFLCSTNDHFSIFRRTNNDSIEFKGNDAKAERVVIPNGTDLMNQSTVSVTYTLGGMVRIYVDGELMGEMPQNGKAMEADDLILGHFDIKRYWTGDIYSIRFYNRELNAFEVSQNAEADAVNYNVGRLAPEPTTAPETTAAPAPETTKAPETTAAPETTKAPETTAAPETEAPATEAPAATNAPETTKAPEKSGCGSFVAVPVAIIAILGTALIVKKRD